MGLFLNPGMNMSWLFSDRQDMQMKLHSGPQHPFSGSALPSYAELPRDALPSQEFAPRGGGSDTASWLDTCDTSWLPTGAASEPSQGVCVCAKVQQGGAGRCYSHRAQAVLSQ